MNYMDEEWQRAYPEYAARENVRLAYVAEHGEGFDVSLDYEEDD